jgi:hypothetical protein
LYRIQQHALHDPITPLSEKLARLRRCAADTLKQLPSQHRSRPEETNLHITFSSDNSRLGNLSVFNPSMSRIITPTGMQLNQVACGAAKHRLTITD